MSFATEKRKLGRTPCTIVEIDLDFCQRDYGVAPCVAAIGVTGADRCYRTRSNCQDPTNYSPAARTYRFSTVEIHDPAAMSDGMPCLPYLVSVTTAPTKLDPGASIGLRASITCLFRDAPYSDRGVDPYVALRSYNPETRSTYFKKFRARNPFYVNRALRVLTGYLVDGAYDAANFQVRHYVMDTWRGPDSSDQWSIVAKDILKLADDNKAQAPVANTGTLLAAIGAGDLGATLTPSGIGDLEYAASGTVYINKEAIAFTRTSDTLTFTSRGTDGTTADVHDAGATVQQCLRYTAQLANVIIADLLENYAGIDASLLDTTAWATECETWLTGHTLTRLIVKPTGVKTLLDELCQQGLVTIWPDEVAALIRLSAVRPPYPLDITELGEDYELLADSVSVSEDSSKRITQVQVYSGQIDLTIDDRDSNYDRRIVTVDGDAEDDTEYGDTSILRVYAKWLTADDVIQSALLGFRLLSRYRDNLVTVAFSLDAKDSDLWTGDAGNITCRQLVDASGAQVPTLFQVVQVQDPADGTRFNYQALVSIFAGRYAYFAPDGLPDYDVATDDQRLVNGFFCGDDGKMSDLTDGYLLV